MKRQRYYIEIRKEDGTSFFSLENLHQIYGLLVGQIDSFSLIFQTTRQFKTWYRKERYKGREKILYELLDHQKKAIFTITKDH